MHCHECILYYTYIHACVDACTHVCIYCYLHTCMAYTYILHTYMYAYTDRDEIRLEKERGGRETDRQTRHNDSSDARTDRRAQQPSCRPRPLGRHAGRTWHIVQSESCMGEAPRSMEHSGTGVMPKVSGVKAAANGRALAPKARLDEQDGVHGRLGVLPGRRRAQRDLVPLLAPHMLGLGREAARGGRGPEERGTQRLRLLCQRSRRMRPSQQPVRAASQRGARKLGRHREFV